MSVVRLQTSELEAWVADNEAFEGHDAGRHSLAVLKHRSCPESIFVPGLCGVWFEHVVDGEHNEKEYYFEPSRAEVSLTRLSDSSVSLYWPELPLWKVEAVIVYEAVEPHFIDLRLGFTPKQPVAAGEFLGFFFANYIHRPEDPAIYFFGEDRSTGERGLIRACSPEHGVESTYRPASFSFKHNFSRRLDTKWMYGSFGKLFFADPFFFGYFRNLVYCLMFADSRRVWFAHSPSGGGPGCPAWDFVLIVPKYNPGTTYEFKARLMLCERLEGPQIRRIYEEWRGKEER